MPLDIDAFQSWVGRAEAAEDVAAPGPLAGLASLLDHATPPWIPGELPPLAHWLYFVPRERQSLLDRDGHLKRGEFLPPVPLPRRMWAGSRVRFLAPIPIGTAMRRRSTIASVSAKSGRSGPMVFVTIRHEINLGSTTAIIEEQDIVFRAAALPADSGERSPPRAAVPESSTLPETATLPESSTLPETATFPRKRASPNATRTVVPDPLLLFRFSALTFNAHRIHYDRDYARQVEGYAGLVVHGPLIATLLMDHFLRLCGAPAVRAFSFRAERPLFDTAPFELRLAQNGSGAQLWATDSAGAVAVSATVACE